MMMLDLSNFKQKTLQLVEQLIEDDCNFKNLLRFRGKIEKRQKTSHLDLGFTS